jgi:hypothetical protein
MYTTKKNKMDGMMMTLLRGSVWLSRVIDMLA